MNATEIRELWVYAAQQWPTFPVPAGDVERGVMLQVWKDNLGDLDANSVRAAMVALGGQFFPSFDALRAKALDMELLASGFQRPPAWEQAWGEVWQAVSRRGRNDEPEWSHPVVAEVVEALGWATVCDTDLSDVAALRAHFRDMLRSAGERYERSARRPAPLVAAIEAQGALAASERRALGEGASG